MKKWSWVLVASGLCALTTSAPAQYRFSESSAAGVNSISAAVTSKVKKYQRTQQPLAYYDLKISRLCDEGGVSQKVLTWTGGPDWPGWDRMVAMSIEIGFPQSKIKPVTIPLVVASSSSDTESVQNCDDLLVSNLLQHQRVTAKVSFSARSHFSMNKQLVAAVAGAANAFLAFQTAGGSALISNALLLSKNVEPLTKLTNATADLIKLVDANSARNAFVWPLEASENRLSYRDDTAEVFSVYKVPKVSIIPTDRQPISVIATNIASAAEKDSWEQLVFEIINAHAGWATDTQIFGRFCPALRRTLASALRSDHFAVAAGLYYHAADRSADYLRAGDHCLEPNDIKILQQHKFPSPYDKARW